MSCCMCLVPKIEDVCGVMGARLNCTFTMFVYLITELSKKRSPFAQIWEIRERMARTTMETVKDVLRSEIYGRKLRR
mgnify:FL=1